MITGSCLCGKVTFEISGKTTGVGFCHCSKCRKVSGTGSNAVVWSKPEIFKWLGSTDSIEQFDKGDGWVSTFCSACGSPVPHQEPSSGKWLVPAGLFDESPELKLMGHIHVGSKASWDVIGDEAPQFEDNT